MKDFVFVTGNQDKITMLEKFLGTTIKTHELDLAEIQSLDIYEVAEQKARDAYKILKKPVLIDDVSLEIHALKGLPGPFVKFFLQSVGPAGICNMAGLKADRSATARIVFGYFDGAQYHCIDGVIEGSIAAKPKGDTTKLTQMGWNPIFIPNGQTKTIAQMDEDDLLHHTPRGQAIPKLKDFLNSDE